MTVRDLHMEAAWKGEMGNTYFWEKHDTEHREPWWNAFFDRYPEIETVLEVGCGKGVNLKYMKDRAVVSGVDINEQALARIPKDIPTLQASAADLPFEDESFDLVFTSGVLIHAPEFELDLQMSEIVRVSKRYVLAMEYDGNEVRGWRWITKDGLWSRDYGGIYQRAYDLKLLEEEEIDEGTWGGVTAWMLEK